MCVWQVCYMKHVRQLHLQLHRQAHRLQTAVHLGRYSAAATLADLRSQTSLPLLTAEDRLDEDTDHRKPYLRQVSRTHPRTECVGS